MKRANGHWEQRHASQVLHSDFQNSAVRAPCIASIPTLCQESWKQTLTPGCSSRMTWRRRLWMWLFCHGTVSAATSIT